MSGGRRTGHAGKMIDERLLADPTRCPSCQSSVVDGPPVCPICHVPLRGDLPSRVWDVSLRAAALLDERARLVRELRALVTHAPALQPAAPPAGPSLYPAYPGAHRAPAPARRDASPLRVRDVLLGLGVLLLTVAALIFLAVAWGRFGLAGKAGILSAVTAAAALATAHTARRSLIPTAEALASLTVALLLLDAWGVRWGGILGADRAAGAVYWSLALAAVAAVAGAAGGPPPCGRRGSPPSCWGSCLSRCSAPTSPTPSPSSAPCSSSSAWPSCWPTDCSATRSTWPRACSSGSARRLPARPSSSRDSSLPSRTLPGRIRRQPRRGAAPWRRARRPVRRPCSRRLPAPSLAGRTRRCVRGVVRAGRPRRLHGPVVPRRAHRQHVAVAPDRDRPARARRRGRRPAPRCAVARGCGAGRVRVGARDGSRRRAGRRRGGSRTARSGGPSATRWPAARPPARCSASTWCGLTRRPPCSRSSSSGVPACCSGSPRGGRGSECSARLSPVALRW